MVARGARSGRRSAASRTPAHAGSRVIMAVIRVDSPILLACAPPCAATWLAAASTIALAVAWLEKGGAKVVTAVPWVASAVFMWTCVQALPLPAVIAAAIAPASFEQTRQAAVVAGSEVP